MKIVQYPHPALRHPAVPLTSIDKKVRLQAGAMLERMYKAHGLGLAAPQVALPIQLTVVNVSGDSTEKEFEHVFINPVVVERMGGLVEGEEGCLSFPDLYRKVRRFKQVVVQGYNLDGKSIELTTADLEARLLQHEIDHLHAVLFIDKMGAITKLSARSYLKDFEKEYRQAQRRGEIPADVEIEKMLRALEAEYLENQKPETGNQKPESEGNGAPKEEPPRL